MKAVQASKAGTAGPRSGGGSSEAGARRNGPPDFRPETPPVPGFIEPMHCRPVRKLPSDPHWSFEVKFDGYRCIAIKDAAGVRLYSRSRQRLDERFPEVAATLETLAGTAVLDGEIVALDEQGQPSYQRLQDGTAPVCYFVFDLLRLGRESLLEFPLESRRDLLRAFLPPTSRTVRMSPVLAGPAEDVSEAVRALGFEGVVGKRLGSRYEPGARSGAWIKHRNRLEQEFVIGGYLPAGERIGSLLLGVHEGEQLACVGQVEDAHAPGLAARLARHHRPKCPFAPPPSVLSGKPALDRQRLRKCRWVEPTLVCRVAFAGWTPDGGCSIRPSAGCAPTSRPARWCGRCRRRGAARGRMHPERIGERRRSYGALLAATRVSWSASFKPSSMSNSTGEVSSSGATRGRCEPLASGASSQDCSDS